MKLLLTHTITVLLLCFSGSSLLYSQSTQTIAYTTKEGLSSNSVYRTVIDRRGFLWIATENGLARFDGRKFETYTTTRGLTDNEIVDLFIDSSGIIWAIPFRRSPCYYNEKKDRFENEETDRELSKIELANTHKAHVLQHGGMSFSNNLRNLFVYKDKKTTEHKNFMPVKTGVVQKIVEYKPGYMILFSEDTIRYFNNGRITRVIPLRQKVIGSEYLNNKVYLAQNNRILVIQVDNEGNISQFLDKEFPFEIRIFCNTTKSFAVTSFNGFSYLLDTATLTIKYNIPVNMQVRNVLEDKDGNTWLSTMEDGLIKIQPKRISSYTDVKEMEQNFNALVKAKNIIAGTNNGEVYVYDGLYNIRRILLTDERNIDAWVRKIVETPKGIYVSTQTGSFLFNEAMTQKLRSYPGGTNKSSKIATLLNDSLLGMGTHAQAYKYNLNSGQPTDSIPKRIISLTADRSGRIYIGSNDGLYRWDKDSLYSFGKYQRSFAYRVNTLICSPDNIIWVGLGSDSLLALKEDKLIASIPLGGIIPGNICKSLFCNKPGELWLGTNQGLNRIAYKYENEKFSFNNTYFGVADGLIGEQVNDITIKNDTVYVATSGGISYLPASLSLPVAEIATFITRVTVNGVDQDVQDSYTFPYNKNDITIGFSGIDLTGFIPLFEYSINNDAWQRTTGITIKLLPGFYKIRVKAIKRDGTPSPMEAIVSFTIRAAFWNTNLFRFAVILLVFGSVIYFLQKRNKQKQKAAVAKAITEKKLVELEMQALMSQINPHFVFNSLNSIKGFIYDKDLKQADKYLDKFSDLLRGTLDNAQSSIISLKDEIKYLDTYLQLEMLRFKDKFSYELRHSPDLETDKVFVPAMLLQPFVENAIRHGIRHLENRKGKITIAAAKEGDYLVCTIEDNGIGRERAQQLRSEKHIEYQSRGMQLSKRRAELYGIEQEIIDKQDETGLAAGTVIVLRIPLSLHP